VNGSSLVVAGLGEIGLETARLARALGMKVSGTKRSVEPLDGIEEVSDNHGLPALLAGADAVVNTLPGTPYTEKLFNRDIFAAMKPGTVFVNVGRGTVVDEEALLEALDNGQVSYACLDVFAVEPLPRDSPLWHHPKVLVSPHTSALSAAENRLIAERFCGNLRIFLAGGGVAPPRGYCALLLGPPLSQPALPLRPRPVPPTRNRPGLPYATPGHVQWVDPRGCRGSADMPKGGFPVRGSRP
jgi:phosphoglycerate dehydrogenase-like enzyme